MALALSPVGNFAQFFANDGTPLSGGKVQFCQAGSFTVNQNTWSTAAGAVLNPNPLILDSSGRLQTDVWVSLDQSYNVVLLSPTNIVLDSTDNVRISSASVSTLMFTAETATATSGQTLFNLAHSYTVGSNTLQVSVNGAVQISVVDYNETSSSSVTFTSGLNTGDVVLFRTFTAS